MDIRLRNRMGTAHSKIHGEGRERMRQEEGKVREEGMREQNTAFTNQALYLPGKKKKTYSFHAQLSGGLRQLLFPLPPPASPETTGRNDQRRWCVNEAPLDGSVSPSATSE